MKLTLPTDWHSAVDVPALGLENVAPGATVEITRLAEPSAVQTIEGHVASLILQGWGPADADAKKIRSDLDVLHAAAEKAAADTAAANEAPIPTPVGAAASLSTPKSASGDAVGIAKDHDTQDGD